MDFGDALRALRTGYRLSRSGWNGKGMFIYLVPAGSYFPTTSVAKAYFGGQLVPYKPYIAIKTVDEDVVPWLASQTDLLAEDYFVVG